MLRYFTLVIVLLLLTACGPSRADMQSLQTRLDETAGRLSATQEQLETLEGRAESAEQQKTSLEEQLSELENELRTLEEENATLQEELAAAEAGGTESMASGEGGQEVERLRRELANRPSQAEVDLLAAQLRLLEEDIATLEEED
jgi:chromosome segregation ATPase